MAARRLDSGFTHQLVWAPETSVDAAQAQGESLKTPPLHQSGRSDGSVAKIPLMSELRASFHNALGSDRATKLRKAVTSLPFSSEHS